jgi:two-component system cell cycle response regulator DivK
MVILLVEDQDDVYDFYSDVLASAGYSVAGAGDGERALALVPRLRPDLVLLDLGLPKIDGFAVARALKRDPGTRHIPVIALTGFAVHGVDRRARDAGCDAVLFKPCPTDQVLSEIDARLRAARQR